MGRDDLNFSEELDEGEAEYTEVNPGPNVYPLFLAVEKAEETMVPLMLEAEASEHIAEEMAPPGMDMVQAKSNGGAVFKAINALLLDRKVRYTALKISSINDKAGAKLVYAARQEMKDLRLHFTSNAKKQVENAKTHIKNVGLVRDRFIRQSSETEDYLQAQEDAYNALVNADKAAKQKALDDRNNARMAALLAVGATIGLAAVVTMDEQQYSQYLAMATKGFNEEQTRLAAEAAALAAEREKEAAAKIAEAKALAAEREAIAKERTEMAEARSKADKLEADRVAETNRLNAAVQAERAALEAEKAKLAKAEADRVAKAEADKRKAAEDARLAAKAEADRVAAAEHAAARALVLEALRPDAEKLEGFADFIAGKAPPEMDTQDGTKARTAIVMAQADFLHLIRANVARLKV